MVHNKGKNEPKNSVFASVEKEMAKPRITRSARIAERNLDTARIPEQSTITMRGTVYKIISASNSSYPEKVQIAVEGADPRYRDLRIENILTDENGDDVRLKKGALVEVTVAAKPRDPTTRRIARPE
jgi:hypothetical protein